MSLTKVSRRKTILTIIISAILISAAVAGGKWGIGYADITIPTVMEIDPDLVHVKSAGFVATITGGNFVGVDYTKVFFIEPDGNEHQYTPISVLNCDPSNEYDCSTLTVYFPSDLFLNQGVARIYIKNYDQFGEVTGVTEDYLYLSIIDELFLPIIMKNG